MTDGTDHFSVFGLPRRLGLDLAALESTFFELSREFHPDRFAGSDDVDLAEVQRQSARVNDAYRVLRDPVLRAEHLLALEGITRPEGEPKCPPELLEEVFEIRERMAEDPVKEKANVLERVALENGAIEEVFEAHDLAPGPEEAREALADLRKALDRRKFLMSLLREVEHLVPPR